MQDFVDKILRLVRISLLISAIQRVLRFVSGKLMYKSNSGLTIHTKSGAKTIIANFIILTNCDVLALLKIKTQEIPRVFLHAMKKNPF